MYAEIDGDAARLHRRRFHYNIVQLEMPAVKGEGRPGVESLDYLQHFLQAGGPGAPVHAGVAPLGLLHCVESAAHADAQLQPAAGNQVHRADHLRQQDGMAQGHQHHGGAEPHSGSAGGDGGQGGHRFQPGFGGQAVAHPDRSKAGILGPSGQAQHGFGIAGFVVSEQQAPRRQQAA